jgi:hypothetical protein
MSSTSDAEIKPVAEMRTLAVEHVERSLARLERKQTSGQTVATF